MIHNDVLRSLRYTLNVNESKLVEMAALGGLEVPESQVQAYLLRDEDPGYVACDDRFMAHFLNGLIVAKRGAREGQPSAPIVTPVTNNMVLKKIRVAFELQDEDLVRLIEKAGLKVTKSELSALFRSEEHKNYRPCGDQFLRNIIKGLVPGPPGR